MSDIDLRDSDYETLFKRDPMKFFEAMCINLMYAEGDNAHEVIERQKAVFEKWLLQYNYTYRELIVKNVENKYAMRLEHMLMESERKGRLAALTSLPLKQGLIRKHIDITEVNKTLKQLKETPMASE